ncbi:MAG: FAD-dependent oxidoreductase [Clostridiales bacterium]|nr:FAD-dependent oxidoreductase [Clostridiales bacterium]
MLRETQRVPVRESTDVLVVGGGIAGVAAAVAARRLGAQVLLLEKSALLGGLATNGLINWYEPLCDGRGEQMITGLAEELLRLSIRYGDDTLPRIWQEGARPVPRERVRPEKQHPDGGRFGTFFSPTMFQLGLDELLLNAGVELRLDILAARPLMAGKRCVGVFCESKTGREFFPARVAVDATGDADLFFRAGAPCVSGRNYLSFVAHGCDLTQKRRALEQRRWIAKGADLHGVGHPEGYPRMAGTTNEEVTRFLLDGRRMLRASLREGERTARDVTSLPSQAQFRTTRRIRGAATLTEADQGTPCPSSIGLAGDFEKVGDWYEIPWGSLYCEGYPNLLATGRMISSEGWAWDVTRVIPVCALTGQAAGTAAALALEADCPVGRVPLGTLQQALERHGVRIHR